MANLTPDQVLEIFAKGPISSVKTKRRGRSTNITVELDLGERRLQDRLYQHLSRHPDFGDKQENGTWRIPEENLPEIAYWAIKPTKERRINKNLMLTERVVDLLSELPRGQMSAVVDFSVELFFSILQGDNDDVRVVANKLRLYCKLLGVEIDGRLKQLIGE
jgi:hypothetical protein